MLQEFERILVSRAFENLFLCMFPVEANNYQAPFEHFQGRWFFIQCLMPPTGLPARGKVTHKLYAEAQIWTGRYEGIDK
jgi:hypothetical protein